MVTQSCACVYLLPYRQRLTTLWARYHSTQQSQLVYSSDMNRSFAALLCMQHIYSDTYFHKYCVSVCRLVHSLYSNTGIVSLFADLFIVCTVPAHMTKSDN